MRLPGYVLTVTAMLMVGVLLLAAGCGGTAGEGSRGTPGDGTGTARVLLFTQDN
jgi:hypothetical protein